MCGIRLILINQCPRLPDEDVLKNLSVMNSKSFLADDPLLLHVA